MGDDKSKYLFEDEDTETYRRVLAEAVDALERSNIPYLAGGSMPMVVFGDDEASEDIDFLVKRDDGERALRALEAAGFEREPTEEGWLLKAVKERVLVDLIFQAGDHIDIDDEMLERGTKHEIKDHEMRIISAEDFVVMQALAARKEAPEYWFTGVEAAVNQELDWAYLRKRAQKGTERVLSLLLFARAEGAKVPDEVLRDLARDVGL